MNELILVGIGFAIWWAFWGRKTPGPATEVAKFSVGDLIQYLSFGAPPGSIYEIISIESAGSLYSVRDVFTGALSGWEVSLIDGDPGWVKVDTGGYKLGDVNGDGVVDGSDRTAVQRIILGYTTLSDGTPIDAAMMARADVNHNGVVDMGDTVAIDNLIALQ